MTDDQMRALNIIKEKAAEEAFKVYAAHILRGLDSMGLTFQALNGTLHSHSALLQDKETKEWLVARCRWEFSTDPEVIAKEVANATHEAAAAEAKASGL